MAHFNLNDYETVESRIERYWAIYPEGSIVTDLIKSDEGRFIVKASIYRGSDLLATGYAEEVIGSSPVNKTSALENCETSAIGRALANAGFATKGKRASREEMDKVQRGSKQSPAASIDELAAKAEELTDIEELRVLYTFCQNHGYLTQATSDGELLADILSARAEKIK